MKSDDKYGLQPHVDIIQDCQDAQFDIVFVHGLNLKGKSSHGYDTWTADLNGGRRIFWPKELLPTSVPNLRVMLLAYNSNIVWNAAFAGISDHANSLMNELVLKRQESPDRPIIFICHSLGGLVVKQALLLEKPEFQDAINSTRGLVFFATPHRGATGDAVEIGFILADIARAMRRETSNTLPELLEKNSRLADTLSRSFAEKRDQFHIISVYETRPMKPYGIIVGKTSAVLEDPPRRETQLDINRDHSAICKFPSADNRGYQQFIGHLTLMMQNIRNTEEETRKNETLKNLKDNPPKDDLQFLQQAEQLANWYRQHKSYEECAELNDSILKRCDKNPDLGLNDQSIRAAYNRAFALQGLGRYEDSEEMYRLAIKGRQARPDNEDKPTILDARRQLAMVLYHRKKIEDAERELKDVLEEMKRRRSREEVLDCQADLAFLFQSLGRWEDSESNFRSAFEGMRELGSTDEKTLLTQHRFAFVLQSLGKNDESEKLYRDLLRKREEKYGVVNFDTLATMRDLAHVLQKKGELPEAEMLCEQALSGMKKLLPRGDIEIEWTDASLGMIRKERDRTSQ
ncbi:hypothetical protein FOMA001_g16824 [Fusarium oxysporum f. sp. matthiolae]|nr:hypothetical protein FOMA001_g16824 [Fusarium oxysporum f. sp. matthiolae]